jgi:RND superfamily putative drug exporter
LQITPSSLTALPSNLESAKALTYLTSRVGDGVITPIVLLVDLGTPGAGKITANSEARIELAQNISKDAEVLSVAQGDLPPYVDATGRFYRIFIFGKHDVGSTQMQDLVRRTKTIYVPQSNFEGNHRFYLGGAPAQGVDLLEKIQSSAPIIFSLAILIIGLLLGRALKSIVVPLKAIALDLISIAVALWLGWKLDGFFSFQSPWLIWILPLLVVVSLLIKIIIDTSKKK